MASERFRPTVELTADEVRALTTQAAVARR
jgi:hypothetical protein